jgi:hypothetical protein
MCAHQTPAHSTLTKDINIKILATIHHFAQTHLLLVIIKKETFYNLLSKACLVETFWILGLHGLYKYYRNQQMFVSSITKY